MQLKLEKRFDVPVPAALAWSLLADVKAVSECMPGAELTEKVDDTHYKGMVRVKIGPVAAAFRGEAEIQVLDHDKHELQVVGKGAEVSGTSAASMKLTASLRKLAGDRCELTGAAEVSISGKLAAFGARMVNEVSDRLFAEFVKNFTARAVAMAAGKAPAAGASRATAREINALAILMSIIAAFLRRLFKRLLGRGAERIDG